MAFVFVRIFGIETRLGVCEIPKILTSAKSHTQRQIVKAINAIFGANPSVYLVTDKLNDFSAIENQLNFGKDRIIIEIFSVRDYFRARKMGFKYAMFSTSDIAFALRHKIPFIAIHTSVVQSESGANLARKYIANGGCIFAYSTNESAFINAHKGKSVSAFYVDYYDMNANQCKLRDKSKCKTY